MDYKRLTIHPLGSKEETLDTICEIVERCNGIFEEKILCGIVMYFGNFDNGEDAHDCMNLLKTTPEVSHVGWVETL